MSQGSATVCTSGCPPSIRWSMVEPLLGCESRKIRPSPFWFMNRLPARRAKPVALVVCREVRAFANQLVTLFANSIQFRLETSSATNSVSFRAPSTSS